MKTFTKLFAAVAFVCLFAPSCKKDKGPEGPTDFAPVGCEAVDLGLSVKWASFNVGATNDHDYGSYFAWGETDTKDYYDWSKDGDYKWGVYDKSAKPLCGMKKYTGNLEGGDGLSVLKPEDDPATVKWGTRWRTPTFDEITELNRDCEWLWLEREKGFLVTGKNGNSIFLPSTGEYSKDVKPTTGISATYWSSTVGPTNPELPYLISCGFTHLVGAGERCVGRPVRAVAARDVTEVK